MHDFIEILTQKLDQALEETVNQIDQQEEKINSTLSDLSLKKESLNQKKQQTLQMQNDHSQALASQTRVQSRYSDILSQMVDNLKDKDQAPLTTAKTTTINTSVSPFSTYPIVCGDVYQTYRLTAGQSDAYQQISLYNQFYTYRLEDYLKKPSKFAIYIVDAVHFLKILFDEIRHVESCRKYQEADWKSNQVNIVLNESYRTLILLIEELLAGYNATLQVSPIGVGRKIPNQVRIRVENGIEQVTNLTELSKSVDRINGNMVMYQPIASGPSAPAEFVGFLKTDLNIIFPLPLFDLLNPHVLKIMLGEFKQRQHHQTMEFWRQSEIRIQQLGDSFETELHEQLIGWLN